MGAFLLIRKSERDDQEALSNKLCKQFSRQGFGTPIKLYASDCDIYLYKKVQVDNENLYYKDEDNFAMSVGTLIYKGTIGRNALKLLFNDFDPSYLNWQEIFGHFFVLIAQNGNLHAFIDIPGFYKVFYNSDKTIFSSLYLAVLDSLDLLTVDPQGVYEYMFLGGVFGDKSVIKGVDVVPSNTMITWNKGVHFESMFNPFKPGIQAGSIEEHIQQNLANLRRYFNTLVSCFGSNIDTALSGGFDTRLTLALLLEQGITPRIHVYGKDSDLDVKIAKKIAQSESLALEHIDKSKHPQVSIEQFPDIIARNFCMFDGYPYGGIFGNGLDLETRLDRCAHGELMLNGGGGEIFRNNTYLLNKSYDIKQLVDAMYYRVIPQACTSYFSTKTYIATLADKIKKALGAEKDKLSRGDIEYLLPCFWWKYWMARNNIVNSRFGWTLTPFPDYNNAKGAIAVPVKYKYLAGQFEAAIIREINERLASYDSVYGYNFACEPPLSRVVKDFINHARPPSIRKYSYAISNTIKQIKRPNFPYFLTDPYVRTVIDSAFPYISIFFNVQRFTSVMHYNQACTLEYLFQRYDPIVPDKKM